MKYVNCLLSDIFFQKTTLQRGRVLIAFWIAKQLNISAINKDNLFVALVFYGVIWCSLSKLQIFA